MASPNIILIMADQLRWDCTGYAGNPDVRTPNLDVLAAHGVTFSEAICQQPLCVPSRTTVMTGQYPSEHGVCDNRSGLPETAVTLPGCLREAGYQTAAIGKMHFVPPRAGYGFDLMRLAEQDGPGREDDDYHPWLASHGKVDRIDIWDQVDRDSAPREYWTSFGAMCSNLPEAFHSTTWIGDQAVRFLSDAAREPFFLWVSFVKPHHPFDPPAPWHRLYDPATLELPPGFVLPVPAEDAKRGGYFDPRHMTEARFRRVLAFYYANISHIDMQVGRILATLTARGRRNNVIVFCADHGDYMGQHGLILKGNARPYDALLRVPLLVAGVTGQRRGEKEPALAELTDLMPTLLEIAGADCPPACSGKSLVPHLLGSGGLLREAARAEGPGGLRVVRSLSHKLIEADDDALRALYNLNLDPHEFRNRLGAPEEAAAENRLRTLCT